MKEWWPLVPIAEGYDEALVELHHAILLIASSGQALAEPAADDSHRSMKWDAMTASFQGILLGADDRFRVRVNPEALTAAIVDSVGNVRRSVDLAGQTLEESLRALQAAMPVADDRRHFPLTVFEKALPNESVLKRNLGESDPAARRRLANCYANTQGLLDRMHSLHRQSSPIRCWPHHFDMATLISGQRPGSTVGIGFSPGDSEIDEPYWYVSPFPPVEPGEAFTPHAPAVWHDGSWHGAALRLSAVAKISVAQGSTTFNVLEDCATRCLSILRARS